MSTFIGNPATKGGGQGNNLQPAPITYGDVIEMTLATYDIGESGTATHCLILQGFGGFPPAYPTGADPVTSELGLIETATPGAYTLPAGTFCMTLQQQHFIAGVTVGPPPVTDLDVGGDGITRMLAGTLFFPVSPGYYLLGTATLGTPGDITTVDALIDYQVIYVHPDVRPVLSGTAGGVDTLCLLQALQLAGHNIKVDTATTINGLAATRRLRSYDETLEASTLPALLDVTDLTNVTTTLDLTMTTTPDNLQQVAQESTKDT